MQMARNIAIIAALALVVAFVPGGGNGAEAVLAVISMGFLAVLGLFGHRLYKENGFTLLTLTDARRAILYGAIGTLMLLMLATDELFDGSEGTLLWVMLAAGAVFAVARILLDARRYS